MNKQITEMKKETMNKQITEMKKETMDKIFEIQKHKDFITEELLMLIKTNKIKLFNSKIFSNTKIQKEIDKEIIKLNESLSKYAIAKFKKILFKLDKKLKEQLNKE